MKRHHSTTSSEQSITGIAETTAERTKAILHLLGMFAEKIAAMEQVQQNFRFMVINKLANIDTTVQAIMSELVMQKPDLELWYPEKVEERAKVWSEYINEKSKDLGIAMVKYVYSHKQEPPTPSASKPRRKKQNPKS